LEDTLSRQLEEALTDYRLQTCARMPDTPGKCTRMVRDSGAQAVFGPADPDAMKMLLDAVTQCGLPFIAVSHTADVRQWLDAMDLGAADCAAPPFEPRHMDWMLSSLWQARAE
jgi:DNA-binding NtrC family response regulator